MAELVQAALAASVARAIRHDPGVRIGDDPEDVHQARVAVRRLRADLRTFADVLDESWHPGLQDELRWLGGELGRVRDADVLLERLRRRTESLPTDDAAGVAALLRRMVAERETARAALLDALRSDRYVVLLEVLADVARAPRLRADVAPRRAWDLGPGLLRDPWRRLTKAARQAADDPAPEQLHDVRIRAKRSRYAAEALTPALGRPASRLAKRAATLQDVLGEHQDAVVAEAWLRAAASDEGPAAALVAGELVTLERAAAEQAEQEWPAAWDRAARAWRKTRDAFHV
jgi:CHAD domain-containing protein